MLKSLQQLAKEECVEIAENIEEQYYKNAAKEAGVTVKKLRAAIDRVYADGYYGPISKSDWIHQDGRRSVADIKVALKIVRDAMQYIPDDIEYFDPTDWDDVEGYSAPELLVSGEDIHHDVWRFYYNIYGR